MRSYAITALIGTGLLGLAPQAQAAAHARTAHPQPERPGAQNAAHARPADPQREPARPAVQPAAHAQAEHARQAAPPAAHLQAQHARQAVRPARVEARHAQQAAPPAAHVQAQQARPLAHTAVRARRTDPRPDRPGEQNVNVRSGETQETRPAAGHPARIRPADPQPQPQPGRSGYSMHLTGQAAHWEVSPGELQTVRWTLTNTGNRPLEHAQLVAAIPAGWSAREGQGCLRRGEYLGCDLGALEPGHSAAVLVPMVVQGQPGTVRLTAWSRGMVGVLTIPGPMTSIRVVVNGRR
ncbi:NEW3 domain-containing protein [Actinoallomurus soli]|uniref:NEW3 domain-containing protein n=1 Tax=Actinoallomurus soli TaxID=2952535 RepID=UPI0020927B5E|nr:NEW3 domain-containing protein [Actinoallomurus soli]MCO5969971.1 NEW3 domain-containing protein [Actinoallomurus soli]